MATKNGIVKKTPIADFMNIRKSGIQAICLRDDDELIEVKNTNKKKEIFLVSKNGQCIRFDENDVRPTGRTTMGVIGMNLEHGDEVVGMQLHTQGDYLLIVSENGLGKLTQIDEFSVQKRGGKGVKCYKITEKTGNVVGVKSVNTENEIIMITNEGIIIRMAVSDISILGRNTSGVKLMNVDTEKEIKVASFTKVREDIVYDSQVDDIDENSEYTKKYNTSTSESDSIDTQNVNTNITNDSGIDRLLDAAQKDSEEE